MRFSLSSVLLLFSVFITTVGIPVMADEDRGLVAPLDRANLHQAKVAMSLLSKRQEREFWTMVGRFAQIEVILESCSRRSRIERRIMRVAAPCVQKKSLKRIKRHFRRKMAYYRKRLVVLDCHSKDVKALLRAGRKAVDQVVTHVRNQCNACFFC